MKKFRAWTVVRFTLEVEVEAEDYVEATKKIESMDPMELMDNANPPKIEVEDCFES